MNMDEGSYFYHRKDIRIEVHGGLPQDNYIEGSLEPLIFIKEDKTTKELVINVDMPLVDINTLKINLIEHSNLLVEASVKEPFPSDIFHAGILSKDFTKYHVLIPLPKKVEKINRISVRKDVVIIRLKYLF